MSWGLGLGGAARVMRKVAMRMAAFERRDGRRYFAIRTGGVTDCWGQAGWDWIGGCA